MKASDGSPVIGQLHAIVPMVTDAVPLLGSAQASTVNAAWIPWKSMTEQNREKVHKIVMEVLQEIETNRKYVEKLMADLKQLEEKVAKIQRSRSEMVQGVGTLVADFKAKLTK